VGRRKHARRGGVGGRRWAVVFLAATILLIPAGSAAGAYLYDRASGDRILPGVRIGDVDVGGMTRTQVLEAVSREAARILDSEITILAGTARRVRTPRALGVTAGIEDAVDGAFAVSDSFSWIQRAYHRLRSHPVGRSVELSYDYPLRPVKRITRALAEKVARPPRDAAILLDHGKVVFQRSREGRALDRPAAIQRLMDALRSRDREVRLPLHPVLPKVTEKNLGGTITVDLTTNTLRLYDGFKVIRKYDVGTAMPGYSTPSGTWTVIDKRENPAWYNPAPDGWGKDMPLVIPGGPSNPLGTRAIYLDASGIRIHGTPATASVGHYVSHGCIRMRMWEAEALYPLVEGGIPVLVYGAPPWGIVENPGIAGT
jgi:lipoprotein-anchoring transpeptidase ErfK/SrfK